MTASQKLTPTFGAANSIPLSTTGPKKTTTLGLRLTAEEKSMLKRRAGSMGLGPYIRQELLGPNANARQARGTRPVEDWEAIGQILGLLAKTGLGPTIKDLSKAAEAGCLIVDDEIAESLLTASRDIETIKTLLMLALNVKED